jgi:citrate synthase
LIRGDWPSRDGHAQWVRALDTVPVRRASARGQAAAEPRQAVLSFGARLAALAASADRRGPETDPDAVATHWLGLLPRVAVQTLHGRLPSLLWTGDPGFAGRLAAGLQPDAAARLTSTVASRALETVMVALADHGQASSTAAVRLVASTGGPVGACLLAAVAALSGERHGDQSAAVRRLLSDTAARGAASALAPFDQGLPPGFGHAVHDRGDPRTPLLQAALDRLPAEDPLERAAADALTEAAAGAPWHAKPNWSFNATRIFMRLGLSPAAASLLFACARSAGWLAHWREVAAGPTPPMLRPAQIYTGPGPRRLPTACRGAPL